MPSISIPISNSSVWWVVSVGLFVGVVFGIVMWLRHVLHERRKVDPLPALVHLRIRLPKEAPESAQGQRDWRETLTTYETLFTTLGGVNYRPGDSKFGEVWWQFWYGRHDHLALEMVAMNGQIYFYIIA